MLQHMIALCIGFGLDFLFGDPHFLWHPVQGIGKLIEWLEKQLYRLFHLREERELDKEKKAAAGAILAISVIVISVGTTAGLLWLLGKIHPWLKLMMESIICYQMLAAKSLKVESMKVYDALKAAHLQKEDLSQTEIQEAGAESGAVQEINLQQARHAVSMIVGRDADKLSEEGIIKAAVETVAENTSDGEIAPLFYMMLFGPVGGVLYKTVNTMDSMIGYRNDRYCYFGTVAARLDDILNFLPARLAALGMIAAAFLLGLDGKNAWRIFKRDRYQHKSPNSAQTEAACAGALNVQLAGDAYYFGQLTQKPTIGDANRKVEIEDIKRANRLMYGTSVLVFVVGVGFTLLASFYLELI